MITYYFSNSDVLVFSRLTTCTSAEKIEINKFISTASRTPAEASRMQSKADENFKVLSVRELRRQVWRCNENLCQHEL